MQRSRGFFPSDPPAGDARPRSCRASDAADRVSIAILAAGRGSRIGREKLLLPFRGAALVGHAIAAATALGAREVIVVVSSENRAALEPSIAAGGARVVVNLRAHEGMATSIGCAVQAVRSESRALVLLQGDQPLVGADMIRALVDAWAAERVEFAAASYDGVVTTPVLFDRSLFAELGALRGDRGARPVLARHRGRTIDFPAWRGRDIDTEDDYRRLLASAGTAT